MATTPGDVVLGGTRLAAALLTAVAATGCAQRAEPAVDGAWVRLAAVPGRPAAGYFTLHGGAAPATLVAVSAAGARRVELHETRATANGMMAMDAIPRVALAPGAEVAFAPGGRHAMLFGVPLRVTPGASLTLTFRFADGRTLTAPAKVVSAGAAGPD